MAPVRYSRIDGSNSPNYCLALVVVVFVLTCVVGAGMTLSSSVGPVRMGISVEQFMGVMPWKASGNKGNLPENDVLKRDTSQGSAHYDSKPPNVQEKENLVQESQSPDSVETPQYDSKENKEVVAERDPHAQKAAEGSVSESVHQINEGGDWLETKDQKVNREKLENVTVLYNDGEGKVVAGVSPEEVKKPGEPETKFEESGGYQDKKPAENEEIEAMKNEDGVVAQGEMWVQEPVPAPNEDSGARTSESGTLDGLDIAAEAPSQFAPWPAQMGELEKGKNLEGPPLPGAQTVYTWKVCNVTAGPDYIPCLDNIQAIKKLRSTKHYEHRERHCPDDAPTCLVDVPKGYRTPIKWPKSRDLIWFANVPHTKLVEYKGQQNWIKAYGRYLTFPGGGTQFKHGALRYIDFIQKTIPEIYWGKRSRVVLDVGCGVASFGGYLFDRDVLTMSLAPKDEHEAQVQFALERGIPAISAVMGTKRLPFPALVFDIVHCARCRVSWHAEGGKLLLELNRVLRPGGYFVWSATPVYRRGSEDAGIWKAMSKLTKSICWELVQVGKDKFNGVSAAFFRKPTSNSCYEGRPENDPPLCEESDDRNAAWYTPLQACIHKVPTNRSARGTQWPARWPLRLYKPPYWLKGSDFGGGSNLASSKKFTDDSNYWKHVVANSYLNGIGIDWSSVRNVMDMSTSYGGLAAALKDLKLWVMNVVTVNSLNSLPIIYERGLFGIYHDWCESFSTYPRSYDLLHADRLFSAVKKRCKLVSVMAEVDRILRPGSWLIVRDYAEVISEVESMAKSIHWKIQSHQMENNEGLICVQKTIWRPTEVETLASAIA